jgi:hypothetical protein
VIEKCFASFSRDDESLGDWKIGCKQLGEVAGNLANTRIIWCARGVMVQRKRHKYVSLHGRELTGERQAHMLVFGQK